MVSFTKELHALSNVNNNGYRKVKLLKFRNACLRAVDITIIPSSFVYNNFRIIRLNNVYEIVQLSQYNISVMSLYLISF